MGGYREQGILVDIMFDAHGCLRTLDGARKFGQIQLGNRSLGGWCGQFCAMESGKSAAIGGFLPSPFLRRGEPQGVSAFRFSSWELA